jgi:hypothetical protein
MAAVNRHYDRTAAASAPCSCWGLAGFDFGWRVMESYVRIGMLYDGRRFYELRCPLDMLSYHSRRHGVASSYYALMDFDRHLAENVNRTKSALAPLLSAALDGDINRISNGLHP